MNLFISANFKGFSKKAQEDEKVFQDGPYKGFPKAYIESLLKVHEPPARPHLVRDSGNKKK